MYKEMLGLYELKSRLQLAEEERGDILELVEPSEDARADRGAALDHCPALQNPSAQPPPLLRLLLLLLLGAGGSTVGATRAR